MASEYCLSDIETHIKASKPLVLPSFMRNNDFLSPEMHSFEKLSNLIDPNRGLPFSLFILEIRIIEMGNHNSQKHTFIWLEI